jgi:hypothetical protein
MVVKAWLTKDMESYSISALVPDLAENVWLSEN